MLSTFALFGSGVLFATPSVADVPPVPAPPPVTVSGVVPSTNPPTLPVDGPATDAVSADYYDENGNYIASTPESIEPADSTGLVSNSAPDAGDSLTELPDPEGTVAPLVLSSDSPAVVADIQSVACSSGQVCGTPTYSGTVTWHVSHTQYSDTNQIMWRFNVDVKYSFKARHIFPSTLTVHSYMTKEDPVVVDHGNQDDQEYYYDYWSGVKNSGHASKVQRYLEYQIGGWTYYRHHPWIHEYVHGDGTMYFHTGDG